MLPISDGHLECIKLLLAFGADPNRRAPPPSLSTSLHHCAARGDWEGLQILLDAGSDVQIEDAAGDTALHVAAKAGHLDCMRLLVLGVPKGTEHQHRKQKEFRGDATKRDVHSNNMKSNTHPSTVIESEWATNIEDLQKDRKDYFGDPDMLSEASETALEDPSARLEEQPEERSLLNGMMDYHDNPLGAFHDDRIDVTEASSSHLTESGVSMDVNTVYGWVECVTDDGHVYYYHVESQQSQWAVPDEYTPLQRHDNATDTSRGDLRSNRTSGNSLSDYKSTATTQSSWTTQINKQMGSISNAHYSSPYYSPYADVTPYGAEYGHTTSKAYYDIRPSSHVTDFRPSSASTNEGAESVTLQKKGSMQTMLTTAILTSNVVPVNSESNSVEIEKMESSAMNMSSSVGSNSSKFKVPVLQLNNITSMKTSLSNKQVDSGRDTSTNGTFQYSAGSLNDASDRRMIHPHISQRAISNTPLNDKDWSISSLSDQEGGELMNSVRSESQSESESSRSKHMEVWGRFFENAARAKALQNATKLTSAPRKGHGSRGKKDSKRRSSTGSTFVALSPSRYTHLLNKALASDDNTLMNGALLAACHRGDVLGAEKLLLKGATPDCVTDDLSMRAPVHLAAAVAADSIWRATSSGQPSTTSVVLLALLQEYGADLGAKDRDGNTALHIVATLGNLPAANFLLQSAADVHSVDEAGRTALHRAAEEGHVDVCKLLVSYGALTGALNSSGQTPLAVARRSTSANKEATVSLLASQLVRHASNNVRVDTLANTMMSDDTSINSDISRQRGITHREMSLVSPDDTPRMGDHQLRGVRMNSTNHDSRSSSSAMRPPTLTQSKANNVLNQGKREPLPLQRPPLQTIQSPRFDPKLSIDTSPRFPPPTVEISDDSNDEEEEEEEVVSGDAATPPDKYGKPYYEDGSDSGSGDDDDDGLRGAGMSGALWGMAGTLLKGALSIFGARADADADADEADGDNQDTTEVSFKGISHSYEFVV